MAGTTTAPPPSRSGVREPDEPAPGRRSGAMLALGSLLVSLAVAELALRLLHPLPDPYAEYKRVPDVSWPGSVYVPSAYPPHFLRLYRAEPGLPGIGPQTRRFTTNNLGYRGDSLAVPRPAGEVRVFMLGGSTTECAFLDDSEAVTARLQAHLRRALPGVDVRVYGAGKSGDRSWDHVAMLGHRIAHLQPDVVVVFAGINDVSASVAGRDYLLRGETRPVRRLMLAKMALSELQVTRLVHAALASPSPERVATQSHYRQIARRMSTMPLRPLPPLDPAPYAENLATLAGIARAHGARVVMMTQATTWNTTDARLRGWHWILGKDVRYPEPDLDRAMGRFNAAMLSVGQSRQVPVFDLAGALPKSADYFYDDVHFNVRGADTAARMLAQFMVDQGVVGPQR